MAKDPLSFLVREVEEKLRPHPNPRLRFLKNSEKILIHYSNDR